MAIKTLSIDEATFNLLTSLAEAARVSKAAFIRELIRREAWKQGMKDAPMPLGVGAVSEPAAAEIRGSIVPAPDTPVTYRDNRWITFKELSEPEKLVTILGNAVGITVDFSKHLPKGKPSAKITSQIARAPSS